MDGDGIELTSLDGSAAFFDLDGDGFAEQTGWVGADDALLAVDSNGNGKIDDISELFGSDKQSGFAALAEYDTNNDGVVDALDNDFGSLRLWQDLDQDGRTDDGELFTLADLGVASLSVAATSTNTNNNGNIITATGIVTFEDGTTTTSADVGFDLSQVNSVYIKPDGFTYDTDVFNLPFMQGMGEITDLWVAMTQDATLKTDVNSLISEARAGSFSDFVNNFEGMLSNWADTEDAIWMSEVPSTHVVFAFEASEHQAILASVVGTGAGTEPITPPAIKGYILFPSVGGGPSSGEINAWLEENDYVAPGLAAFVSAGGPTYPLTGTITGGVGSSGLSAHSLRAGGDSMTQEEAPDIAASRFAFLQKLMGQEYQSGDNFITSEQLLVATMPDARATALDNTYDEMKDYFSARFLAQSAWSILATEGSDADLGGLAPFKNLYLNPFNNRIAGDQESFVVDLIDMYRADNLGTDEDALNLIALFNEQIDYLGIYVAANYADIDRALIESTLGTSIELEGTAAGETLSMTAAGIVLGHAGDDTINGSTGMIFSMLIAATTRFMAVMARTLTYSHAEMARTRLRIMVGVIRIRFGSVVTARRRLFSVLGPAATPWL